MPRGATCVKFRSAFSADPSFDFFRGLSHVRIKPLHDPVISQKGFDDL